MDIRYAFWNNKGGTGKTSLAFQAISGYAELHPTKRILVVDMCPQANLSELMLGGLNNNGSTRLLQQQQIAPRRTVGGYFQARLPSPYSMPQINPSDYLTHPITVNHSMPPNIHLMCGDPLLELQSNAVNTLANNQIPGTDAWIKVVDWLNDFLGVVQNNYDTVFIDCNPSFSMYTQIALAASSLLVLPVMADDSSRRALQNAFSLVYGLQLPSAIYAAYAFGTKLTNAGRTLPKVHLIAKNRLTQYMGAASAYSAVLGAIDHDVTQLLLSHPHIFNFAMPQDGFVEVRDFQTTGVVAFAKGLPFSRLGTGRQSVNGQRIDIKLEYLENARNAMARLVAKL
ncbi:ParA family protein [Pseudorhodoferax sp. Leaf265]|uniref:ParA family protein n=1 Tax=Pseudorhodoferax sp. Leaf265 TaxID=1736315 RepID=UPI0006F41842|nr:ParA family protein [Pseudorhodoferax sp. Leaf265]KQP21386.1 ATPase [Pseudorhodoferax sp. Leaf265]